MRGPALVSLGVFFLFFLSATPALAASRFWVGGTGTWDSSDTTHWSATTCGAGGASVPNGDVVTFDQCSGGGTVTVNTNFSVTSITAGTASTTLDFSVNNNSPTITSSFSDTGTVTRGLKLGNGTFTMSRATTATIWTTAVTTGLTFDAASSTIVISGNAASDQTRTFSNGGLQYNDLRVTAGSGTLSIGSTNVVNNLDFTGFAGSLANFSFTVGGSLTLGSGMSVPDGTATITFTASTTGATITSNGVLLPRVITINTSSLNTGGTVTLADNLSMGATPSNTRLLTVTQGTFDANGKNVTIGGFSSSNSNTRGILMGSGTWTLVGTSTTIWNTSTLTGATVSGNGNPIIVSAGGNPGSGTRTFTTSTVASGATEANAFSFNITGGSDTVAVTNSRVFGSLDFTGFSGTFSPAGILFYGSLKLSSGMTFTPTGTVFQFLATSGTETITSNGQTFDNPVTINAPGATVQLGDNLVVGTSTAASGNNRAVTLTAGTFDLNGKTLTQLGTLTNTGSNTRAIAFGTGGIWNNVATTSSTIWNTSGTGFSMSGTGTIKISGATVLKTFVGGGYSYPTFYFANPTSGGQITITGSNTFDTFRTDAVQETILFSAGTTQTITNWDVSGSAGNVVTLNSTNTSTFTLAKSGGGSVTADYLDISHSIATGGTWNPGAHSINHQSTAVAGSGWNFSLPNISSIAVATSTTSAVITWTSDIAGSTQVFFGPSNRYGTSTPLTDTSPRVTSHTATLTNLLPCKLYHYKVESDDALNNPGISADRTFTTLGCTASAVVTAQKDADIATSTGGTLTQGNLTLTVPINFTTATDTVTFQANQLDGTTFFQSIDPPSGKQSAGDTVFNISAMSDATSSISTFDTALTVTLAYDAADISGLDASSLTIYRYDDPTWTQLTNCSVNSSARTVTCETTHFSDFSIFGTASTANTTTSSSSGSNGAPFSGPASALPGYKAPQAQTVYPDGHIAYADSTLESLRAQVQALLAQLATLTGTSLSASATFTRDLRLGATGEDVKALQQWLNAHGYIVAGSGAGSVGEESTTFGAKTKQALVNYQKSVGLPATGFFGSMTRKILTEWK